MTDSVVQAVLLVEEAEGRREWQSAAEAGDGAAHAAAFGSCPGAGSVCACQSRALAAGADTGPAAAIAPTARGIGIVIIS